MGFGLWALGFGLCFFGEFASEIQVFMVFSSPGSNDIIPGNSHGSSKIAWLVQDQTTITFLRFFKIFMILIFLIFF